MTWLARGFCFAALAVLFLSGCGGESSAQQRDGPLPHRFVDSSSGVSVRYPTGWRVDQWPVTRLLSPRQILVLTSFSIRQRRPDPNCTPRTAVNELPPTGVLLFLLEQPQGDESNAGNSLGNRPAHFHLERLAARDIECFGASRQVVFRGPGREIVYVLAYFGPKASVHTKNLADRALDSLRLQAPKAVQNPPPDAIVFDNAASDSLDAQIEIAYVPARGGAVISLTTSWKDGMVAAEPRWSPDGSRIAFIMSPRGHLTRYAGDGDIYVMNADGTDIRRLTQGLDASSPAWSPDGSRIVYIKGQGQALAVMSADGSDQHIIARARSYYEGPAWSPGGQVIAYQSDLGRNMDDTAIFTIRADGTAERQLTPRSASAGFPAWSTNGSQIAYSSSNALWVMNSDGTNVHQITTCRLPCVEDFDPAWSPTGRELVFVRQENGGAARRLYVLKLSTAAVRPVTPKIRWAGSPDWRR